MSTEKKTQEKKTKSYIAYETVENEWMAMAYCSWVEARLAAADKVLVFGPLFKRRSETDDD